MASAFAGDVHIVEMGVENREVPGNGEVLAFTFSPGGGVVGPSTPCYHRRLAASGKGAIRAEWSGL